MTTFTTGDLRRLSLPNLHQLARMCPEGSERWAAVQAEIDRQVRGSGDDGAGEPALRTGKASNGAESGREMVHSGAHGADLNQRRTAPEKAVEAECDALLERLGFDVTRFSQARASRQTEGVPDRYARHPLLGIRVWIEYKAGDNGPSRAQVKWHERERAAGGAVITAWGAADLMDQLRALGAPAA